jgi:hypothetical protein
MKILNLKNIFFKALMFFAMQIPSLLFAQLKYDVSKKGKSFIVKSNGVQYTFSGQFSILYSSVDPDLALRPAGIKNVLYNVPTWKAIDSSKADLRKSNASSDQVGDGFDEKILKGTQNNITSNIYNSGKVYTAKPSAIIDKKDSLVFVYPSSELYNLTAVVVFDKTRYPKIKFTLNPKKEGYFSIGYTGAPCINPTDAKEIWQPLIWQEKRFPDNSYLTPSYMATLPTTLVNDGFNSIGVLASPAYLPFDPLPVFSNSQFGVAVRDENGMAKPQVFAPIFGSQKSLMKINKPFSFSAYLVIEPKSITYAYEQIARAYFGFKDYRKNDIATLNTVFDNIVDYSMTNNAWFVDSLKGYAYSTDVPGAVKNVSSLNPLELAIVTDNKEIFEKRAYPLMEYMLSREKFLFSLDSTQKIQSPSRSLNGPIAPISELSALYNIFNGSNPFYISLAKKEFDTTRVRNLNVEEKGDTWITAMHIYKATKDIKYLQEAVEGANDYIEKRVNYKQTDFNDEYAGEFFFWPSYTNRWIELLELYELTGDKNYLKAAQDGARHYTMFTWMAPEIPSDSLIKVNPDGKAPHYAYLKGKGHSQMSFAEELAPAWRLSETGLTPESSGTSTGHRAIFMANYAPWMLRLGYYTNDAYLKEVAKAAIIGRYRNFPGYHINTARTTAYEKFDFPMYAHKKQSVNSFHYNHIMPMASMLLDYLITDAFVRTEGEIDFPSQFIEGYAYLQNKFYGGVTGKFYNEENITLWMPQRLLSTSNVELNYVSGRRGKDVFVAFLNQSNKPVTSTIDFNDGILPQGDSCEKFILNGKKWDKLENKDLKITVPANGVTSVKLENVNPTVIIQEKLTAKSVALKNDYISMSFGKTEAMLIRLGDYANRAFIYLKENDTKFSQITLRYQLEDGKEKIITKSKYPFEFTVDIPIKKPYIQFKLEGIRVSGEQVSSGTAILGEATKGN